IGGNALEVGRRLFLCTFSKIEQVLAPCAVLPDVNPVARPAREGLVVDQEEDAARIRRILAETRAELDANEEDDVGQVARRSRILNQEIAGLIGGGKGNVD